MGPLMKLSKNADYSRRVLFTLVDRQGEWPLPMMLLAHAKTFPESSSKLCSQAAAAAECILDAKPTYREA